MLLLALTLSTKVCASPVQHAKVFNSLRETAATVYESLEKEFITQRNYADVDKKIEETLDGFGKEGREAFELYFASLRIPCLLKKKEYKEAKRWSLGVCRRNEGCLAFFHVMFQIADADAGVSPGWARDLTDILSRWDGMYRPFKGVGFQMALAPQTLDPWLPALVKTAVLQKVPELLLLFMKGRLLPMMPLLDGWLDCLHWERGDMEAALKALQAFNYSVDFIEKKMRYKAGSESWVLLLFMKTQAALASENFEEAWEYSQVLMPHFRELQENNPSLYSTPLLRAMWGQYFAASETGRELDAVKLFLEIKKKWPQSGLLKFREPYHVYWFLNRKKAYPFFFRLVQNPIKNAREGGLRVDFTPDELKQMLLVDMLNMGEWSWAGELLVKYPQLVGMLPQAEESFARLQYHLWQFSQGKGVDRSLIDRDLEMLQMDATRPYFPIASVMLLVAHGRFQHAREACWQSHRVFDTLANASELGIIFGPLFNFLEDVPPTAETALFEDFLRDLLDEHLPEWTVSFKTTERPSLSSQHERTLEKIFEPMCGIKRLHQVHLKRRQVEALFHALGFVGGFGRLGKGSHHVVGLEAEGRRISTVLSAENVPHYQVRQLQILLLKADILPERYKDQLKRHPAED